MNRNTSVVVVDDSVDDRESEACSFAFGRKVREEELFLVCVGNAATRILHCDDERSLAGRRCEKDFSLFCCFDGVVGKVDQRSSDLLRVEDDAYGRVASDGNRDARFHVAIEACDFGEDVSDHRLA